MPLGLVNCKFVLKYFYHYIFSPSVGTKSGTIFMCESVKYLMLRRFFVLQKVENHHLAFFSIADYLSDERL